MVLDEQNPIYAPFFGVMGAASAIIFSGKLSADKKKKMEELCKIFDTFEKSSKDPMHRLGRKLMIRSAFFV